jgi:hypothetical protein
MRLTGDRLGSAAPVAASAPPRWASVDIAQPAEEQIDITIAARRATGLLLRDIGSAAITAAVLAVFVMWAARTTLFAFRVVDNGPVIICGGVVLAFVFAWGTITAISHHCSRTTFRVTPETLTVLQRDLVGPPRTFGWPREAIFEVRRSGDSELHVRLRRDVPCRLLRGRSPHEIDDVAAAINTAFAAIPPVASIAHRPSDGLSYEIPSQSYEIEILPAPDGVTVVVPGVGDSAIARVWTQWNSMFWVVAMFLVFFCVQALLLRTGARRWGVACVGAAAVLLLLPGFFIARRRRGQALNIIVSGERVYIDHPGLFFRRRDWPRAGVTDVSLVTRKAWRNVPERRFVRIKARARWSVPFCHGRDTVEMERVVVALRNAVGLPAPLKSTRRTS